MDGSELLFAGPAYAWHLASLSSSCITADSHKSGLDAGKVSRSVRTRAGGRVISASRALSSGSVFYQSASVQGQHDLQIHTFRPLNSSSISLLRACRSDTCPETADRSVWNVERYDASESSSSVLDCHSQSSTRTSHGLHIVLPKSRATYINIGLQLVVWLSPLHDCRGQRFLLDKREPDDLGASYIHISR